MNLLSEKAHVTRVLCAWCEAEACTRSKRVRHYNPQVAVEEQ